jgi:hypothetical protein
MQGVDTNGFNAFCVCMQVHRSSPVSLQLVEYQEDIFEQSLMVTYWTEGNSIPSLTPVLLGLSGDEPVLPTLQQWHRPTKVNISRINPLGKRRFSCSVRETPIETGQECTGLCNRRHWAHPLVGSLYVFWGRFCADGGFSRWSEHDLFNIPWLVSGRVRTMLRLTDCSRSFQSKLGVYHFIKMQSNFNANKSFKAY